MTSSPEGSALVRAYRRVIPALARSRINERVPLTLRYFVKRRAHALLRLLPSIPAFAYSVASIRRSYFYRGPDKACVKVGLHLRVALIGKNLSPIEVRCQNLLLVTTAFDEAELDYFCVRGNSDTMSVVAVEARDRGAAIAVLRALAERTTAYVTLTDSESRVTRRQRAAYKRSAWSKIPVRSLLRLTWFRTDPDKQMVFDDRYGCEVQFWKKNRSGLLTTNTRNRVTQEIGVESPRVYASDSIFTRLAPGDREPLPVVRTREDFTHKRPDDIDFPIDVVFTWVDGVDPSWQRRRAETSHVPYHEESANNSRYLDRDELKYALRSIAMYAPWVRHIYIVTDDQTPEWLDLGAPGISIVDHRDIFEDMDDLPTFNSHAIETQLHHIEGLSEHFLYFNDDMMLGAEVTPQTFFHANGLTNFFQSPANVPQGPPGKEDVPVTVAGKNNREALEKRFGNSLTQKMKHAPYALRRSILSEIEKEFSSEYATTASNQVRSFDDISVASSLYHYYAFQTGRSVPSKIKYVYVDLGKPDAARALGLLALLRDTQAFCLNSTTETEHEVSHEDLHAFLEAYFPLPSKFEKL